MEKTAQRKTYKDPALNKIIQEKGQWNRQVSALINDIIHFKKSMNGWPSKYYKERTRITSPVPIDLGSILTNLATEFQDLANQGNSIIQEQTDFARAHVKRHSDRAQQKLEQKYGPAEGPATTPPPAGAPKPDLAQQLGKGLASQGESELIKLAFELEEKYTLEAYASNPFSRFVTRLFNPKFGFGEGARVRRLRMTMLDYCVKSYKQMKKLHKEIVKSSKVSIDTSHKMMTMVWNYWNAVNRLFSTFKTIKPEGVKEEGGSMEDEERKKQKAEEEGHEPDEMAPDAASGGEQTISDQLPIAQKMNDFLGAANVLGPITKNPTYHEFVSILEKIQAAPGAKKMEVFQASNFDAIYNAALGQTNAEHKTTGTSFMNIASQLAGRPKTAQRQLRKVRHQIVPGPTSGQRLEIYNLISQIRRDLNIVMDLLENGFDQKQLTEAIGTVNREMTTLRTMIRSLYYSEKPEQASSPFF